MEPDSVSTSTPPATEEPYSPLLEFWAQKKKRNLVFCLLFCGACFAAFGIKLYVENWQPEPAVQPSTPSAELKALRNLFISGQIAAAKAGLIAYVDKHPQEAAARLLLASAYREVGNYTAAEAETKRAIALDPQQIDAYAYLGDLYNEFGWYYQALEQYAKVLDLDPDHIQTISKRISIYFIVGRTDLVTKDADFIVVAHPREPLAYMIRGNAMRSIGELEEAFRAYSAVIQLGENDLVAEAERNLEQVRAQLTQPRRTQ